MHTTNYVNTFIVVADDTSATGPVEPQERAATTVASATCAIITHAPYQWTSDDVVFTVHADRHRIPEAERQQARAEYFSVGRPCLRSSPLARTYGWGVHADGRGRVALYGLGTPEYNRLASGKALDSDRPVTVIKAMRSRRG